MSETLVATVTNDSTPTVLVDGADTECDAELASGVTVDHGDRVIIEVRTPRLPLITSVETEPTRYEQTEAYLDFDVAGNWATDTDASHSGGNAKYNATNTHQVEVKFTGTWIAWIGTTDSDNGIATVTLDGGTPENVDCYSAAETFQVRLWHSGALTDAAHTVVIAVTNTKNGASSGYNIVVDAFDIIGTLTDAN
jgi:hypothetical protein